MSDIENKHSLASTSTNKRQDTANDELHHLESIFSKGKHINMETTGGFRANFGVFCLA